MAIRSSKVRAFATSAIVCAVLVGGFVWFWRTIGVPNLYHTDALLGVTLFCIALMTVMIYQSFKISESAHSLAEDITKDMLGYSRDLFSELYRNSPVPYILIDERGLTESINLAAARLFNVEVDALKSFNPLNFIEGEDIHKVALIPEYFRRGKSISDMELTMRRPDGVVRWVLLSLFPFKDAHGDQKGLLTLVDITKQKLIDQAKTEFVSLASHQLRTPIAGLKWNIELLQTTGKDHYTESEQKYIQKISHGIERMELLVNDFLSVSKFELGTLSPTYVSINAAQFLQGMVDEHATFATQKAVRIETEWGDDLGNIRSDSHFLHMITNNLLANAIKYTPSAGVVRVKAYLTTTNFNLVVTDTGIGIPLEDQDRIFTKMFRATNARTTATDGTGLGLYIVKKAAEILGGTVSFESKEGVGTSFTVVIPK